MEIWQKCLLTQIITNILSAVNTKEETVDEEWETELEKEEVNRMMEEEVGMMEEVDERMPGQEDVKIKRQSEFDY